MNAPPSEVQIGKAFRVAPSRNGKPAAHFWKFWVQGAQIYAASTIGSSTHVSVHSSGEIHVRVSGKDKHQLSRPLQLSAGQWLHALEWRFLIGSETLPPQPGPGKKKAFLIETPEDHVLLLNLILAQTGTDTRFLPHELADAQTVWRTPTADSRTAVLLARVVQMSEANIRELNSLRYELNPRANLSKPQVNPPYMELQTFHAVPDGANILIVVPMGSEAFRVDSSGGPLPAAETIRELRIRNSDGSVQLRAPDGAVVATLALQGVDSSARLLEGVPTSVLLGEVTLSLRTSALREGESFITPTYDLPCAPAVDGGTSRNWAYKVSCSFDGTRFTADIRTSSASLRNSNLATPMPNVRDTEEVIIAAPSPDLSVVAEPSSPTTRLQLYGLITIRAASVPADS